MNEIRINEPSSRAAHVQLGGVGFVRSAADGLGLAASPVFAIMALLTARDGNLADPLCAAMRDGSLSGSMTTMYGLMSVFHLPLWLKRWSRRRGRSLRAVD